MANTKSAAKRARQTKTRTLQNRRALTSLKNKLKSVRAEITAGKPAGLPQLISALDKAVKTGRIHRNAANRRKSRLGKLAASSATAA